MTSFLREKKIKRYANFKMKIKVIFNKIKWFVTEHVFDQSEKKFRYFYVERRPAKSIWLKLQHNPHSFSPIK